MEINVEVGSRKVALYGLAGLFRPDWRQLDDSRVSNAHLYEEKKSVWDHSVKFVMDFRLDLQYCPPSDQSA